MSPEHSRHNGRAPAGSSSSTSRGGRPRATWLTRWPAASLAKVGHAGTLDPLATGILIVCVGAATRLTDISRTCPNRIEPSSAWVPAAIPSMPRAH